MPVSVKPPDQNQSPESSPRNQTLLPLTVSPLIQPLKFARVPGGSVCVGGVRRARVARPFAPSGPTTRWVGPGSGEPTYSSKSIVQLEQKS